MKHRTHVALLAVLVSGAAWGQDVSVYSTTIAQMWKSDIPGFDKTATYTPATEFLGIDANKLGTDALSLHLYGWGRTDLKDQSAIGGKTAGDLTYGYLQYAFDRANAQVKAGRFTINQGVGNEMVDGVYAYTDLLDGWNVTAFAGKPVVYKNLGNVPQASISFQRDYTFGTRLGYRIKRMGEIGLSYLQDGSTPAMDLPIPETLDFTRRQLGADLSLAPCSFIDVTGRTVFDVSRRQQAEHSTRIAESDYRVGVKIMDGLRFNGSFTDRDFLYYYTGSTLPNLFDMNERGKFKAVGGNLTWTAVANLQLVADVRRTNRDEYGTATRAGLDARYNLAAQHVLAGVGYHKVNAFNVALVDSTTPSHSLSHSEARAWVMAERGAFSASLDAIRLHYSGASTNPNLIGKSIESQLVGSVGYQANEGLKVSADLSYADTPLYKKQAMGLVRIEYRFGFAAKGGK